MTQKTIPEFLDHLRIIAPFYEWSFTGAPHTSGGVMGVERLHEVTPDEPWSQENTILVPIWPTEKAMEFRRQVLEIVGLKEE